MRAKLTLVTTVVAALLATPAHAGPGGHVAGTLNAGWTAEGWTGQVSVALDPGTAARDAAVAKIKSVQHYRTGNAFSTQGAHVTALTSSRSTSFDCGNGDGSAGTNSTTFGAVSDPDTPFVVGRPELDLLHGSGHILMNPVWDNAGDPLPETGRDFFPVPGAAAVTRSSRTCSDPDFPTSENDVAPIFGTGSDDPAVPFGVPIYLQSFELPLRPKNGVWSGSGTVHDKVLGSLPIDLSYDVRLVGPISSWIGSCVVPGDKDLQRARSAAAAVGIMRRAGFPHARFGGRQATRYHRHGHYFVDEKFTSSGFFQCLAGKPKVYLAA